MSSVQMLKLSEHMKNHHARLLLIVFLCPDRTRVLFLSLAVNNMAYYHNKAIVAYLPRLAAFKANSSNDAFSDLIESKEGDLIDLKAITARIISIFQ